MRDEPAQHPIPYAMVKGWYGQNAAWLQARCKAAGVRGYTRMTRHQMIEALVRAETGERPHIHQA